MSNMPERLTHPRELEIEEQIKLPGHKWQLSSLKFSPNGLFLASGSWDKQVRIWDLSKLETSSILGEILSSGHDGPVTSLAWLPTIEFMVASSSSDGSTILWNADNGNKMATFKEHVSWVLGSDFTKSGKVLATSSWDKSTNIWDISTLKLKAKLIGHTGGVWKCQFNSAVSEDILCTASEDSSLRLWDLRSDSSYRSQAVLVGGHDDSVRCCSWSLGGTYVAAGSTDMKISVWDTRENKVVTTIEGHEDTVTDVSFFPKGESDASPILVSVGDTTCRFWDALRSSAQQLQCLRQHKLDLEVECLAISPDGSLLSTGGRDNDIVLSTISIPDIGLENLYHEDTFISKGDIMWKKASREAFLTSSSIDISKSRERTVSSTARLVDNAVQQNELKVLEKNQEVARQTIKIKSTATNEMLQSKLMQLQKTKKVVTESKSLNGERPVSPENMELQNQRKKLHHIDRSLSESNDGDTLLLSEELKNEKQKLRSVHGVGDAGSSESYPEYNFQISTAALEQSYAPALHLPHQPNEGISHDRLGEPYEGLSGSVYAKSDAGDSLLYEDIKDITEELIRISDEQRKQIVDEQKRMHRNSDAESGTEKRPHESFDARL